MVDGVGVCSICARVCHKGHDVTYAKFGSFFCDCGAKTDGSCIALVRRASANNEGSNNRGSAPIPSGGGVQANYNPFLSDVAAAAAPVTGGAEQRRGSSPTTGVGSGGPSLATTTTGKDPPRREGLIKMSGVVTWEELITAFRAFR